MPKKQRKFVEEEDVVRLPPPRPAEIALMQLAHLVQGERVLCTTQGRGQLATLVANMDASRKVICPVWDLYTAQQIRGFVQPQGLTNVDVVCESDVPAGELDMALLPFSAKGEAEFTRELMQQAFVRLKDGGRLLCSVDNRNDTWLRNELRKLSPRISVHEAKGARVYVTTRHEPLRRVRDFSAQVAFRDEGRLIRLTTRPGVFAHRQVDQGARSLLRGTTITPGLKVLDLGCGSGAVSVAVALRQADVKVTATDANPRAVACTQENVRDNQLTSVDVRLDCDGSSLRNDQFDLVLTNPPYFSYYRIADLFLRTARRTLRPGGKVVVVCKTTEWYEEAMPELFDRVEKVPMKEYTLMTGVKPQ